MMTRLGPWDGYTHDHRTSLRDVLRHLMTGLREVRLPEVVHHDGARWTSTHSFTQTFSGPACWESSDGRWAFDVDELGWAGIREPNLGVWTSFESMMNGVAARLVRLWGLGVPMHVARTPDRPLERAAEIIERSLAVVEDAEAARVLEQVWTHGWRDECFDSVTVHVRGGDSGRPRDVAASTVLGVTVTRVRWSNGKLAEEHDVAFLRTDARVVAERTAGFWWLTRQEFVEKTWHPSRLVAWCLCIDDVRDLT